MSRRKLDCDRLGQIELVQNRVHWRLLDKDDFVVVEFLEQVTMDCSGKIPYQRFGSFRKILSEL
jgi:hypothetical protein